MPKGDQLSPRQEIFAQQLARAPNIREAAKESNYTYATARNLAAKPKIKARVREIQSQQVERMGVDGDKLMHEIAALAFSDITQVLKVDYSQLEQLPDHVRAAIASVEVNHYHDDAGRIYRTQAKIKMHPKNEAQRLLASIIDPKPQTGDGEAWQGLTVITGGNHGQGQE